MEPSPRERSIAEIIAEFSQSHAAARSRWARYAEDVHPELRGPGMIILQTILRRGPVTATGLSGMLNMDKAFISRQVAQLRALGLVETQEAEADRRVTLLTGSPEAHRAVENLQRRSAEEYHARFAEWSSEELALLQTMLHRFNTSAQDSEFDGPAKRCARSESSQSDS